MEDAKPHMVDSIGVTCAIKVYGNVLTLRKLKLGKSKKHMGGGYIDSVSRVQEGGENGHDQPAVPSEDVEEREEEEFQANLSAGVLPHTAVPEPAGPSVAADKGKVPMPDLDIPAEFLAEDAQARKRFEEEQASERWFQETDWLNLMMQVGSNPALARELLGADVNEENFIECMNAVKEKKKRALADLRYQALKGKPMKKSELASVPAKLQLYLLMILILLVVVVLILLVQLLPMAVSAASNTAGGAFGATVLTDSTVTTRAAMDFC
ncbi:hypothetical protein Tco_0802826 [Tanacetum coccineum]|uniref:Uncharacterized protein n=1 Tax=Tanacetum coccineum TaxID=301880 RepID=A0ABQ5A4A2_9ASTR